YPNRIITGPDGALWFTEEGYEASKIGHLTTTGVFNEFKLSKGIEPSHVAAVAGNIWFTEANSAGLGYVTESGVATYFGATSTTRGIVAAVGNRAWVTNFDAGQIGIVDGTTGATTEYYVPTQGAEPYDVALAGKKTAVWFTEFGSTKIGVVNTSGKFKEYPVPNAPQGLVYGPDGALWFTETDANKIGRITTKGAVSETSLPTANSGPTVITAGPDGALWFTEYNASQIGRITTSGKVTEYATPDASAQPVGITTGPDKHIWFVEHATNAIVRM
ncbi:MAG: Virginiamycin B lyase, partial [Candidatus Eremiobacteraeota bacterium]|nr:Virginiamycin B lyase [Candidatus Eremiobacteraeota bacterium]